MSMLWSKSSRTSRVLEPRRLSFLLRASICSSTGHPNTQAHTGLNLAYRCAIDAEPLHRYKPGGFHPLQLGESLHDGRYQIVHKLGWGGYSTTWAAKDRRDDRYVAVKILVSETRHTREFDVLQAISTCSDNLPGKSRLNQMLDHFTVDGPNGTHKCLVLELVGPSVADIVDSYCKDDRLPAKLARAFAKQALQGLDYLANNDIGHGGTSSLSLMWSDGALILFTDVHSRNLAVEVPGLSTCDEGSFLRRLGEPEIGRVSRLDGGSLEDNVPSHIVRPAQFRREDVLRSPQSVKIIDFGEAFLADNVPRTLHTPLPVRAPEAVFGDSLDRRVDLWSAGCLIFELITGQPPFDVIMLTPPILVQQMTQIATDELPSRWQAQWQGLQKNLLRVSEEDRRTLQGWLEEVYFDTNKRADFTGEDIVHAGELIAQLLKFEPSLRATAREVLDSAWFARE